MEWWKRCRNFAKKIFGRKEEDRQEKEEMRKRESKRKNGWSMGEMGKLFYLLLTIGQSLGGIKKPKKSNWGQMEGMQGERI